jgi:hypothetical protein
MAFTRTATVLVVCSLVSLSATAQENPNQRRRAYRPNTITRDQPTQTLAATAAGSPTDIALAYLRGQKEAFGLTDADFEDVIVTSSYTSGHNGVTHVYLRQRYRGIDVYGAEANVNIRRDGSVIGGGSSFLGNLAAAVRGTAPTNSAVEAVQAAARGVGLQVQGVLDVLEVRPGPEQFTILSKGGISAEPITARLVYQPVGPAEVLLAWHVEIEELSGAHWWSLTVDAASGELLGEEDYIVRDFWGTPVDSAPARRIPEPPAFSFNFFGNGSRNGPKPAYRVFPHPFESPNDGGRKLVVNPSDHLASPFGWHDTDGIEGPEFTVTRGNNVHAYTDLDANNVADPGSDPDGGTSLRFDFPLDLTQQPDTYRPAAVTNLFYWNNIIHDVFYRYGFDEAAGNFQVNTYGKGGLGNDDVRAEAQDGSGTNNANFGTNVDGLRPRMQMFIWTHPTPILVTVHSPAAIAGDYPASRAQFGLQLDATGLTGNAVVANDGVGATADACEPLVGFPAGSIAIVDRGTCEFGFKALTAQTAGAIGVIVANNAPGNPITMGPGAVGNMVTIPAVMVSQDDGNLFKTNAPLNVTLRMNPAINRDSDLDSGVITHEYGHGISNRLTGGPNVVNCLNNAEQMGEGWSDWLALALTSQKKDTRAVSRGVGNYLIFEPNSGDGIRPTAYSTDKSINPSTYASVANPAISQPHGIGYVWATMLWDMYWNLADKHGHNADVYDDWTKGGDNLAIQLVMDGMKLQPCRPGFVDGRNAILAADTALTSGANQCSIWRAFARRGLGNSANQGLSTNRSDGVEAFDMPPTCSFLPPVNPAAENVEDAGHLVLLNFRLEGYEGRDIFATDFPASRQIDCAGMLPPGDLEPTDSLFNLGAIFNPFTRTYHYLWRTDSSWAGTCREAIVKLKDDTELRARFSFQ